MPGLGGFEPPFAQSLETPALPVLQQKTDPVQDRLEDGQVLRSLEPDRALGSNPVETLFTDIEIETLSDFATDRKLPQPGDLGRAVLVMAMLGGYLNRKTPGSPATRRSGRATSGW